MSVPEHRARGDSEVIGGVPASLSPRSVPDCTDRAEPALLAVAALAALAEEAAPLRPAEVRFHERDGAARAGALGVGEPVLPQHERPLPFGKVEAVAARFV